MSDEEPKKTCGVCGKELEAFPVSRRYEIMCPDDYCPMNMTYKTKEYALAALRGGDGNVR